MFENKEKVIVRDIEDEMKKSYLEYSMSVIISRTLPDVRDGLKPSQRRIIYTMHELHLTPDKSHRKCAKIAGDTSGNYHPHGEQVVYPTLVRMAQSWNMRYPLIDGQGNFGSIDDDPPAAMRYTEARLTNASVIMLEDIDKNTVEYVPNYDDTRKEPMPLPSKFPNLLVNGCTGIAVGMATNMPPHNLVEVVNGLIALIDNPDLEVKQLLKYIKGPDFPTGGFIYGRKGIIDYFTTGRGKLTVRGNASIKEKKQGPTEIIISELPYQINKKLLIEHIVKVVKNNKITGISDIRDESDRRGMHLVIKLKRNAMPDIVLNQLYKYTPLQTTYGVINLALVRNIVPKVLNMKQLLQEFIDHRHNIIIRRIQYELRQAKERAHILEGLKIALTNIDEIIKIIRSSSDKGKAMKFLIEKFELTETQANAILQMRLQRLTGLEREKIEQEYINLIKEMSRLQDILQNRILQMKIIKEEFLELKKKFNDPRRTKIIAHTEEIDKEDMIPDVKMIVTISHSGYIKRVPISTYKQQHRGGKGLAGIKLKEDDFVEHLFIASNLTYILFFTNKGKCYWLKVYEIPKYGRLSKGKPIVNMLQLEENEKIRTYVAVKNFTPSKFIVMVSKRGKIKKTSLDKFSHPRSNGIIALKIEENDELLDAQISEGNNEIILGTKFGYANRFNEHRVRSMGRGARGVRGIRLRENDQVVSLVVAKENGTLLAVSENGYGKRTPISDYTVTNRGGKGVITLRTSERNGYMVSLKEVNDNDELIIISKKGRMIRQQINKISIIGRSTQGVKLIKLDNGDKVIDVAKIISEGKNNNESKKIIQEYIPSILEH
ncbi:MAG: DNA gyrase subunit A [Candidatus Cloacimonadota bacterium]|nr:MAG: DNA gyrase subunit A [Candidatus Cloacimonadota bacterium]